MDCLEFRRAKLANPTDPGEDALAHLRECAACQRFAHGTDARERRAMAALAVPVPDGLADRVVLRTLGRAPAAPYRLWALAATVLLSAGVGLYAFNRQAATPRYNFARDAIEHVAHEPESFTKVYNADPEKLSAILTAFGADMRAPIGKVRYIKLCPTPEGTGWHIVFETEQGLVTLMLIPGHQPRGKTEFEARDGMNALVRAAGQGYYVVVAETREKVEETDRLLKQRINWTALRPRGAFG